MATRQKKRKRFSFKPKRKHTQEQLPLPRSYAEFCAMSKPKRKRNRHRLHDLPMVHSIMSMGRRASHRRYDERKAGRMSMAVKGEWYINGTPHLPLVQWHGSFIQRGRKRNKVTHKSLCGMAFPISIRKIDAVRSVPVYGNNPLPRIEDISVAAIGGNPVAIQMATSFNNGIMHLRNTNCKQRRIMSA